MLLLLMMMMMMMIALDNLICPDGLKPPGNSPASTTVSSFLHHPNCCILFFLPGAYTAIGSHILSHDQILHMGYTNCIPISTWYN